MKVIALIPAKNEEIILPTCLNSLKNFVDEVIIYDDHSTDKTAEVAKSHGARVITENYKSSAGWPEYEIRERLLSEARKLGGTHFISLDADEAVTPTFAQKAREYLNKMKPGDSLALRWITLWKDIHNERIDDVFGNLSKDFAFCDDKTSHHEYAFLGVGRTPKASGTCHEIPTELGGILHFQYVFWDKTQIKQAWYRCSEYINKQKSARRINHMYSTTLDGNHVKLRKIPETWLPQFDIKLTSLNIAETWQYQQVSKWFLEYGPEYFEPLQIWHIKEFHRLFVEKTGREPRFKVYPEWVVRVNKIKNNTKSAFLKKLMLS